MPTAKLGPSGAQPRPSSIEEKAAGRALCRILKFLTVGLSALIATSWIPWILWLDAASMFMLDACLTLFVGFVWPCCFVFLWRVASGTWYMPEADNSYGHQQLQICHPLSRALHIFQLLLHQRFVVSWQKLCMQKFLCAQIIKYLWTSTRNWLHLPDTNAKREFLWSELPVRTRTESPCFQMFSSPPARQEGETQWLYQLTLWSK